MEPQLHYGRQPNTIAQANKLRRSVDGYKLLGRQSNLVTVLVFEPETVNMRNIVKKCIDKTRIIINTENIGNAANKVTAVAGGAVDAAGEALDTVAGRRMYRLMQERLELQGRYNDIIALKLDSALKRISELEEKMAKHEQ